MASTTETTPAAAPLFTLERAGYLFILVVLIALPFFSKSFFVFQVTQMLVYAIAIMGLNFLTGINGQFSLGHGAFYAVGAYTTAILVEMAGVHYALTLPAAGVICFMVGFLFGLPALRLESIYLALATFALAVATPQFLRLSVLEEYTGGVQGIVVFSETFEAPVPFGLPLSSEVWIYFFTLGVGALLYWLAKNLVASRTGRALMAIRDNPIAAQSMGVNTALYKATAFGISALITGVAGGLSAIVVKFVAPDSFTFTLSVALLVGIVVGGVGWLPGALIGAVFIVFVPNVAEELSKGLSGAIYGVFLILMIYLAPTGAGGLIRSGAIRLKRLFNSR
ncbi:branched-chain amino acid ABC transporter permease [Pikeienuella piscinae]|uniref:Branched-chain amino acid ABC transporter permease n=1 Tax=Pikeienuella piscinae TaxID=2748098 RepID=A0A7L5C0T1_9RHOB|nr:branched-chain amino acid ABC transporter permease [Pikeienuella piscinae]QIE55754.1 branched-chain amino acid ABC transporter permease [Pikeienuella piscinae]